MSGGQGCDELIRALVNGVLSSSGSTNVVESARRAVLKLRLEILDAARTTGDRRVVEQAAARGAHVAKKVMGFFASPPSSSARPRASFAGARIASMVQLKASLGGLCRQVFSGLDHYHSERAYQKGLAIELVRAGVTVRPGVKYPVLYRGQEVTSRACDLMLIMRDGSRAIVELKALRTMARARRSGEDQLRHYLSIYGVTQGFLVNFPRAARFPPSVQPAVFERSNNLDLEPKVECIPA